LLHEAMRIRSAMRFVLHEDQNSYDRTSAHRAVCAAIDVRPIVSRWTVVRA